MFIVTRNKRRRRVNSENRQCVQCNDENERKKDFKKPYITCTYRDNVVHTHT